MNGPTQRQRAWAERFDGMVRLIALPHPFKLPFFGFAAALRGTSLYSVGVSKDPERAKRRAATDALASWLSRSAPSIEGGTGPSRFAVADSPEQALYEAARRVVEDCVSSESSISSKSLAAASVLGPLLAAWAEWCGAELSVCLHRASETQLWYEATVFLARIGQPVVARSVLSGDDEECRRQLLDNLLTALFARLFSRGSSPQLGEQREATPASASPSEVTISAVLPTAPELAPWASAYVSGLVNTPELSERDQFAARAAWRHNSSEVDAPKIALPADVLEMPPADDGPSAWRLYHEVSRLRELGHPNDYCMVDEAINATMHEVASGARKDVTLGRKRVALPDVTTARSAPIEELVLRRRSSGKFVNSGPMSLEDLARILFFSYGETGHQHIKGSVTRMVRATPSGGGLYPIDVYLFVEEVTGVPRGIYYYDPTRSELVWVNECPARSELQKMTNRPDAMRDNPFTIALAASFARNQWKYRERGYRILTLDCGHLSQSLLTMANSVGFVGLPLMGFIDNYWNACIGLDGQFESVLQLITFGTTVSQAGKARVK